MTAGRFGLDRGVERGKLTREEADAALARLRFTGTFEEAAQTDLVIEAVPERLDLKIRVFRDLDAGRARPHDPGVELVRLPDRRARRSHRPARAGGRLALGVAGAGDEARRDRVDARDERGDHRDRARGGDAVRQEPGRREGHPDGLGLRRQPRLLRHDRRGPEGRERGHRDRRRGRPADDGLLPLAVRPLRHGAGRRLRLELSPGQNQVCANGSGSAANS